jgi:hypothetical protein
MPGDRVSIPMQAGGWMPLPETGKIILAIG